MAKEPRPKGYPKLKNYKPSQFMIPTSHYYEKFGSKVSNIDDEIPFDIPDNWIWCRGYSSFSGMERTKPSGEIFDYIDIESINNQTYKIKEPKQILVANAPSRAVRTGSVLFSLVRPYLKNIALIYEKYSHCIASTGFYVCNSNGVMIPEYMFFLMTSTYVVTGLNKYMKCDNSPSISKDNIENWIYPIPPLTEQKNICKRLKLLYSIIENVETNLN